MEMTLTFLVIISALISSTLFYIKYKKTKNILLIGKIMTRFLVILLAFFETLEFAESAFLAMILSDIIYDAMSQYKDLIEQKYSEYFYKKYYRVLNNIDTPVVSVKIGTGEIIFSNQSFRNEFSCSENQNIFQVIPNFKFEEGEFEFEVCGKIHKVTNIISKNSIDTVTCVIH
jgi:hypothetical protein